MNRLLLILTVLIFISGCNSDRVSEDELAGKTFDAKIIVAPGDQESTLAALFSPNIKYVFNDDGTGKLKSATGPFLKEFPYEWSIKKDSLLLKLSEKKTESFFLSKEGKSFRLSAKNVKFELTSAEQ